MNRRVLTFLFFLLVFPLLAFAVPKVTLLVVVDQMRADYLTRFSGEFTGGLKKLWDEGAVFENTRVPYVPSETAPGHAAISTGRLPSENGIVGNRWWGRETGKSVNAVRGKGGLIGPGNLLCETLTDVLKKESPQSLILSLSYKDRTAVLLGGGKPDLALWFDDKKNHFVSSHFYPAVPAWVEKVKINDESPTKNPAIFADKILETLLFKILQNFPVGKDDIPDFVAVSFSGTDFAGHAFGPDSPEMKTQIRLIDRILGRIFLQLEKNAGVGNFSVILASDHGVAPVPGSKSGRKIRARSIPWPLFQKNLKKALSDAFPAVGPAVLSAFYAPNIYFDRRVVSQSGLNWEEFLEKTRAVIKKCDGVADVYDPKKGEPKDEYLPLFQAGYKDGRSGDLMVRLQKGVLVKTNTSKSSHGSPYDYDRHVPLIFWGPGFKTGRFSEPAKIIDVAPTAARIMGIEWSPGLESRALQEAIK